jgi:predicted class III extradiol MEMO1 family dioxygenase
VDRLGLVAPLRLTLEESNWVELFDGRRGLADMLPRSTGLEQRGPVLDRLVAFARRLDNNLMLDSRRFRQVVEAPVRPPRCIGCYEGERDALRRQLTELFKNPQGPGLPGAHRPNTSFRGALIPHMDYPRGGTTYAWGFKEVAEQTDARLFVIIGTSHYSQHRFTLTRKDFETPLGIVPTDQEYVDRLVSHYGPGLFDDEWLAHLPEHSIELEVVFLQFLFDGGRGPGGNGAGRLSGKRPLRIVPLVVGSFYDCVTRGLPPVSRPDVARMVEALRRTEAETAEPICYIISGDLAHIGPKFQDPVPLDASRLDRSRWQDLAILRHAEAARPAAYFKVIADEADARNICGLSPTYTFLEAVRPSRGELLHYDQYVHPTASESVSFASMAFYRTTQ